LLQALLVHLINTWDKLASYRHAFILTGSGAARHILLVLGLKGGVDISAPVLENNLTRVMRNDEIFHFCGHEDADDNNSELVRGWETGAQRVGLWSVV
jgi:hypothetical protein